MTIPSSAGAMLNIRVEFEEHDVSTSILVNHYEILFPNEYMIKKEIERISLYLNIRYSHPIIKIGN